MRLGLRSGLVIVTCLFSVASCASRPSRLSSPAHGGPAWTRVDTENFRVFTDLDAEAAREIAEQLEQDLDALSQAAFENARPILNETEVVVFADSDDYHHFAEQSTAGIFYRRSPLDLEAPHRVITYGGLNSGTRTRLLHELTHDLFERNFGPAPTWLNEGWAEYYSTVRIVDDRIEIGRALPDMTLTQESVPFVGQFEGKSLIAIPIASVAVPSQLMGMPSEEFYQLSDELEPDIEVELARTGRYLGAWAFVHLLLDGENPYAKRFQVFLREARESSVEEAWGRAFSGVSTAVIDRDFRRYLANGELMVFALPYKPPAAPAVTVHPLTDGEVHLLWAQLYTARLGERKEAAANVRRELKDAIAADPELVEAHHWQGLLAMHEQQWDVSSAALERAARRDPENPRYLFSALRLEVTKRNGVIASEDVPVLLPKIERLARTAISAPQLMIAALYHHGLGNSSQALALAQRAVARNPIDPVILDNYATLLEGANQWQEALEVQRHAVAFVSEDDLERGKVMRAHLKRLEQHVSPKP